MPCLVGTSSPEGPTGGQVSEANDEGGGNRTRNLWIKSPLLCQLSYTPENGRRRPEPNSDGLTFLEQIGLQFNRFRTRVMGKR
jgi:hypothetical protein